MDDSQIGVWSSFSRERLAPHTSQEVARNGGKGTSLQAMHMCLCITKIIEEALNTPKYNDNKDLHNPTVQVTVLTPRGCRVLNPIHPLGRDSLSIRIVTIYLSMSGSPCSCSQ
ncbi:hypothetical protein CEXT_812451 [Caerostris extrusa]|uniref:Uncharacterized protein n=1 Tax=Caerostris extrusa TaxID=172846 RepID=A0AAV4VZR8_CAEEX|nr:hypothetical protein CEXT_812451 [Caerostris extrusa]